MKEINGDIWDYYDSGFWICITTNGNVKSNGDAVMGRGIALEARKRFPQLPKEYGRAITGGNLWHAEKDVVRTANSIRLVLFPTKHNWWEKSSLELIEKSCIGLVKALEDLKLERVYLPRPGCSNGSLDWKDVQPVLERYLDDRFVVVNRV